MPEIAYDSRGRMKSNPFFHARSKEKWDKEDDSYLIEWYGRISREELSFALERTEANVDHRAQRLRELGIMPYPDGTFLRKDTSYWNEEEEEFLIENFIITKRYRAKEIAIIVGKSVKAVYSKVNELKVKGSKEMKYSNERLNDMMNKCGVNNMEMSGKTKIDEKKLMEFRQGKKIPTFLEAIKMAQVLKCSITDFATTGPSYERL